MKMSSDESEDDVDYVPSGAESPVSNSEESENDSGDNNDEDDVPRKRKKKESNRAQTVSAQPAIPGKTEDELWKEFLGADGNSFSNNAGNKVVAITTRLSGSTAIESTASSSVASAVITEPVNKSNESAGEDTFHDVDPEPERVVNSGDMPKPRSSSGGGVPAARSGMSAVLERMKGKKASTLEKSKQDWEGFKASEGIMEDLSIHNRGKGGYLDKKEFLERADYRQFENERDLRLSKKRQAPLNPSLD